MSLIASLAKLGVLTKLASALSRIGLLETATAGLAYSFNASTLVSAETTTVSLGLTSPGSNPRDLVFRGWGERYTPAGITFNALRIKKIQRIAALTTSRWAKLNIVVRTGANSQNAGATLVAIGSVSVAESLDTLTDVMVVLRDPVSGALKTLSNADFTGNEYMIAVWAENSSGAPASCGEPWGTLSNSLGQSYYITSSGGDPKTAGYLATTAGSNARIGFDHLMLLNPVEAISYGKPTQALADDVSALIPVGVPEIVMPPYIFAVAGREANVYFDNLHLADAQDYFHDVTTTNSVGQQQTERWTWIPSASLGAGTFAVAVASKRTGATLVTKTAQLRAADAAVGSGMNKSILLIGDSLINAGVITQTLLDIAAGDVMGVTLLGTQGTAPNRHEGRGGWTINDYTTVGRTYYTFTVSGVATPPAINSTEYSHNGSVYRVQAVSLSGGAGTITCSVTSGGAPLAAGTLAKSNGGAGDANIIFSASAAVSGNPFWDGSAVNFQAYLTATGQAAPNWVAIALGINDCFGQADDAACSSLADSSFAKLDVLIASIKAASATTKIALLIPSPPSFDADSFGASYATGQTKWRYKRNILIWSRQLIAKYAGQEASRVYVVPSNTALDTVNNMSTGTIAAVNSRSAVTRARQNNGVHPGTSGYQQIADAFWAFLKFYA